MVPYSGGTAKILADVMGKRIPLVFDGYEALASGIQAGTLTPLAVASPERHTALPSLPTAAETIPGFAAAGWQVVVAPPGTPESIVKKVNADLIEATHHSETRKRLAHFHRELRALSPAETTAFIHTEQQKWAPILDKIRRQ
jgi:tripartite-type tricarboxylate transporter receptor subunit TctC